VQPNIVVHPDDGEKNADLILQHAVDYLRGQADGH
jgi:hypothetical protein